MSLLAGYYGPGGGAALSAGAPRVSVMTDARCDAPRVTLTTSDTPVIDCVPAPRSASAETETRAAPGATVSTAALIPSAAGVTVSTVSSDDAQTGAPSTAAGWPCESVMESVTEGKFWSVVTSAI